MYYEKATVKHNFVNTLMCILNNNIETFMSISAGFLHVVFPGLVKESAFELFYSRVGQHTSVGNYWRDPYHQTLYEEYSVYLPYINNHIL